MLFRSLGASLRELDERGVRTASPHLGDRGAREHRCFMEVSEEVAEMFKEFDRKEAAYRLRTYRHKAYYSLDRDDGLEHEAVFVALSPHELYERKVTMQELHAAIASLPNKQAKRIYAHFILGMTKKDIARAEGVHEKVVRVAIERGLRSLEKILKKVL